MTGKWHYQLVILAAVVIGGTTTTFANSHSGRAVLPERLTTQPAVVVEVKHIKISMSDTSEATVLTNKRGERKAPPAREVGLKVDNNLPPSSVVRTVRPQNKEDEGSKCLRGSPCVC